MRAETIRPLFPELSSDDEITALLREVSGIDPDGLPEADPALGPLDRIPAPTEHERPGEYVGFDAFARTVVAGQAPRVRAAFERTDLTRRDAPELVEGVLSELVPAVHQVAARTLVAVMHVLRDRGLLEGGSSEERYRYFCRLSATLPFRERVVETFPELGRQVQTVVDGRVRHVEQLVARAQEAVRTGVLRDLIGETDRLVSMSAPAGDQHAGGQSVVVLGFDNGSRVVYKPRAMKVEEAFGILVSRFNESAGAALPVLRVVCGDGWGWHEHADLTEASDRESYYRAAGRLLLVLHVLRASDMHFENVLNHLGLPVVVDAETLFSVNVRAGGAAALSAADRALADSVHSVGFLPTRLFADPRSDESVDVGFLGYEPGQEAITDSVGFAGAGTDRMTVELVRGVVQGAAVRPATAPGRSDAVDVAALCEGFEALYDWVVEHRAQVRAWVEELFSGAGFRVVVASTRTYVQLLRLATHPSFQQSRPLTDVLFHRCGLGRVDHFTPRLVRAEIDDLLRFDVPFFTLRTDSTSVYRWDGSPVADVLEEPPLRHVVRGIDAMSARLRELNLRVIRASYVDRSDADAERALLVPGRTATPARRGGRRRCAEDLVRVIATDVAGAALPGRGSDPTAWVGATITNTMRRHAWRVQALDHGLYSGRSGVALFLTAAGRLLDDPRYAHVAEGYLLRAGDALLADPGERAAELDGGVAGGYAGLAYALVAGGLLGGHDEWVERGAALWAHLADDMTDLAATDLLTGSAGLLATSASMHAAAARAPGLGAASDAVARAALRHLVEHGPELGDSPPDRVYSGFAHGTSGLRHALAVHGRTHAEAAPHLARVASLHEERFGDGTRTGIPADDGDGDLQAYGWCHGAPGILLGRCTSDDEPQVGTGGRAATGRLVEEVRATGVGLNLTLCHGDLGNLLILQRAARRYGDTQTSAWVQDRLDHLLAHAVPTALAERGARTTRNDGLFVGLAGVGYALVDLVAPGLVPGVLALDVT